MFGIGTDIVEINRISKSLEQFPEKFPSKILAQDEYQVFLGHPRQIEYLAGRFAGKEAILKAFGTGLRECSWSNISILNNILGKPYVIITGDLLVTAKTKNVNPEKIYISLSHTKEYAVAFCIIE